MPRLLLRSVLSLFLAGCAPRPAAECAACTSSEFCCLGVCTPLGASCGDAGAPDVGRIDAPDAPDPCAVPEGATSIDSTCVGDTRLLCDGAGERSCLVNERVCIRWIDGDGVAHGSCVRAEEAEPCDLGTPARCDGTRIELCTPLSAGPPLEAAPSGYVSRVECLDHAADATCELGAEGPICASPTDVACDPETFAPTCAAYCAIAPYTGLAGVERAYPCPSGERCVLNAFSFDRPACVPVDATPSEGPNADLSCASSDVIHIREYGYEFDRPCGEHVFGGPTRCWDAPPADVPAHCIGAAAETCDPATYAPSCVDSRSTYCSDGWVVSAMTCAGLDGSLLVPGPCAASGLCVVGAPCDETFVPYCASPTIRITCTGGRTTSFGPFPCS